MRYAIVVITYNRKHCLERLLSSLNNADYGDDSVPLIISIDKSNSTEVEEYAKNYDWKHGEKIIKCHPTNLGLRKHVLTCGEYVNDYDAIAVFEDDIYVSQAFYQFMKAAVTYYQEDDNIAGISLYQHLWNQTVEEPFLPLPTEYDTYFMQCAQSWGQVWMKRQWLAFIKWYEANNEEFGPSDDVPWNFSMWPKTSWLKYHNRYCIKENKYFVYPYKAYTTNFSDAGSHNKVALSNYQVPLVVSGGIEYRFAPFGVDAIRYDAFFNPEFLSERLPAIGNDVSINLYGSKKTGLKRYEISAQLLPYKRIESFGLQMRPVELNILYGIKGTGLSIYDTTIPWKNTRKDIERHKIELWMYEHRKMERIKMLLLMIKHCMLDRLKKE